MTEKEANIFNEISETIKKEKRPIRHEILDKYFISDKELVKIPLTFVNYFYKNKYFNGPQKQINIEKYEELKKNNADFLEDNEYSFSFLTYHNYYMAEKDFRDFLEGAIEYLEIDEEIEFESFVKKLEDAFIKYYKLTLPTQEQTLESGNIDQSGYKSFGNVKNSFYIQHKELLYSLIQQNKKFSIKRSHFSQEKDVIKLAKLDKNKIEEKVEKRLFQSIFNILTNFNNSIELKRLTFQVNIDVSDIDIQNPFSEDMIKILIKKFPATFEFDEIFNVVRLVDPTEYFSEHLAKRQRLFKYFNLQGDYSGILGLFFIGEDSILSEFKEYLNTRNIIYLCEAKSFLKEVKKISEQKSDSINSDFELFRFLQAILPDDTYIIDWLNENVSVSFIKASEDEIKLNLHKLIKDLSPVFNVENNPGNLFEYTLTSKLEEFREKHSLKE